MARVLAFCCHPDDVEFHVAGTLALLAKRGFEIHIATMAGGEVGSPTLDHQQIREKRIHEAAAAAAKLGGFYHYAGGQDLEIQYDDRHRRMAVRVMREVDPQIVLAPPPSDYLIDHEETSRLVRNAAFIASVPHYDCGVPTRPMDKIPHLYYCNAIGLSDPFGRPLPLHGAVNISSVIDVKEAMLACHESQREWLRHINGIDNYLVMMRDLSAGQGKLIGCEYAEGYIQHLGYGYPKSNILKEILGDLWTDLH